MEVPKLFIIILLSWLVNTTKATNFLVTRKNGGDIFHQEESEKCQPETCTNISSGTASALSSADLCTCRCHQHLPAFREDLHICVNDIHECVLAPFVGGSTSDQIPFVFLPLKSQIIHPSKEISFSGIQTPICAVSGARFLTDSGWVDLRNPVDTDVPFRLFRDEGRTFLQWIGETELRTEMSGRLVLVYLMCRELGAIDPSVSQPTAQTLFSPCVSFRVVGSPSRYHNNNVSEVAFSADTQLTAATTDHLSISEYIAIGICSLLLGLIYVASVLLYLHLRKRNRDANKKQQTQPFSAVEEGIIKNNPLLAHFQLPENPYSDSTGSDTELTPDDLPLNDERTKTPFQYTAALVHPHGNFPSISYLDSTHQDTSTIERLPEENVSIVETLDHRDERADGLKALTGTVRKKLYFNPAYFEYQLLLTPPPAALEFLAKIREIIAIAKQKMCAKKYIPNLMGIPEEDNTYSVESLYENSKTTISRHNSNISLKRENSRRRSCTGCPGCEPQHLSQICGKIPDFISLGSCQTCVSTTPESKQYTIQKWLENVPILKAIEQNEKHPASVKNLKRVRSPARSLPPNGISGQTRALSPRPSSERAVSPQSSVSTKSRYRRKICKPKTPPPPVPYAKEDHHYETLSENPPPSSVSYEGETAAKKTKPPRPPEMKKVAAKLVAEKNYLSDSCSDTSRKKADYEADSLERSAIKNGGSRTPPEYADFSSSQPSPSLSNALPMDEEMTMRNAILNKRTGNMTISTLNMDKLNEEEHEYELIVLKKGALDKESLYKLPEFLQRSNEYSLVSEVYVNNGYNYGSAPSSPSNSNCSTFDRRNLKVCYEDGVEKPGKLLIEVKDCADHYIPVDDSDEFEPDTLDRKPSKLKIQSRIEDEYNDSLERPKQILLKSKGSFKKDTSITSLPDDPSNFNRMFGSLREIYEAKTKSVKGGGINDEGKLLSLENKHSKRQRDLTSLASIIPPDLIPPSLDDSPIYEYPKPPRKVLVEHGRIVMKPPLPPKNVIGRSTKNTLDSFGTPVSKQSWSRQEDSGYLSTDSSESRQKRKGSESEESFDEGLSESGAESIETHSVFFGSFRKPQTFSAYESNDGGLVPDYSKGVPVLIKQ